MQNNTDDELIAKAESLQREAKELLKSGLLVAFEDAYSVEVVGSVKTGLMTMARRDIDISCCLVPLRPERMLEIGQRIALRFDVARLTYINPSVLPWHDYKKGLFCGVRIRVYPETIWNVDIWAYERQDYEAAIAAHEQLAQKLALSDYITILRIKSAREEQSSLIYDAVLNCGVKSVEEFAAYLDARKAIS